MVLSRPVLPPLPEMKPRQNRVEWGFGKLSWKATAYVKEITENISPSEKLLLFVLADYHNTAKAVCWPSLPTLAREALMSERQATRILGQLEGKNLLRRVRPRGGHQTTLYQFVALDQGSQNVIPVNDLGVTPGRRNSVTSAGSRDDIRDDKSLPAIRKNGLEPVNTNITGSASAPAARARRLPPEFSPNLEHHRIAKEVGVNIRIELEKFRDHFLAAPGQRGVKVDWDATFRNWLRNAPIVSYGVNRNGQRRNEQSNEAIERAFSESAEEA